MEELTSALQTLISYPAAQAGLILLVSLVVAKITDVVLCRMLRALTRRTRTDFDDRAIEILHRPIFYSVVLAGLWLAVDVLDPSVAVRTWTLGALKTVALVLWLVAGSRICGTILEGLSRMADRVAWIEARTLPLLDNLFKLGLVGLAVYAFLMIWDLDVGPWLASAGIAGIAIGFAAKDTLANIFSGVFIIADAPYKIGDFIVLDTGERGRVTGIGLRSTRLLTRDDVEITLPNSVIANAKIANESGGPWEKARVTVTVGVAYGSDVDRVREVLLQSADSVEYVTHDPEPRVRFTSFGDSALIFRLQCWIEEPVLRGRALDAVNTAVYKNFNAAGIQIPFPQRDVHLYKPALGDAE